MTAKQLRAEQQLDELKSRVVSSVNDEQRRKRQASYDATLMNLRNALSLNSKHLTLQASLAAEVAAVAEAESEVKPVYETTDTRYQVSRPTDMGKQFGARGIDIPAAQARGGGVVIRGEGGQAIGSTYRRVVMCQKGDEVWVEVVDSREIERLQLGLGRAGGKMIFIVKQSLYDAIVAAMERGPNE